MGEIKEDVDKIFNRLRARLYNMVEQMELQKLQVKSYKQTVKDITSVAWNDVTDIIVNFKEEDE